MKRTTKTIAGTAAMIGATFVITTPTPTSATRPMAAEVCLAIDDEPLCDIVRSTPTLDPPDGPDTRPTTREVTTDTSDCVRIGQVHACMA